MGCEIESKVYLSTRHFATECFFTAAQIFEDRKVRAAIGIHVTYISMFNLSHAVRNWSFINKTLFVASFQKTEVTFVNSFRAACNSLSGTRLGNFAVESSENSLLRLNSLVS